MATILEFRPAAVRASGQQQSGSVLAELIFFPGVRYERAEPLQPKRRGKRQRAHDLIDLLD